MAFTPPAAAGPPPQGRRAAALLEASEEARVHHAGKKNLISIVVLVAGVLVIGGSVRAASGTPLPAESGSPSPTASPTASPTPVVPASAHVVRRALRGRRAAVREWRRWTRARRCLALRVVLFGAHSARRPARSESNTRWLDALRGWQHDRGLYHAKFTRLWQRMNNPGGSGWERWRPLVRWVWPASLVSTVIEIMHWESGGNPRVLCGGYVLPPGAGDGEPDPRAGGLMQNKPAPRHWASAVFNLTYAYYHKYLPAGGFGPWAGCRAFL